MALRLSAFKWEVPFKHSSEVCLVFCIFDIDNKILLGSV